MWIVSFRRVTPVKTGAESSGRSELLDPGRFGRPILARHTPHPVGSPRRGDAKGVGVTEGLAG